MKRAFFRYMAKFWARRALYRMRHFDYAGAIIAIRKAGTYENGAKS